jgi:hypothetical protein
MLVKGLQHPATTVARVTISHRNSCKGYNIPPQQLQGLQHPATTVERVTTSHHTCGKGYNTLLQMLQGLQGVQNWFSVVPVPVLLKNVPKLGLYSTSKHYPKSYEYSHLQNQYSDLHGFFPMDHPDL